MKVQLPERPAPFAFGFLFLAIVAFIIYWAKSPIPPVVPHEIMAKATMRQ